MLNSNDDYLVGSCVEKLISLKSFLTRIMGFSSRESSSFPLSIYSTCLDVTNIITVVLSAEKKLQLVNINDSKIFLEISIEMDDKMIESFYKKKIIGLQGEDFLRINSLIRFVQVSSQSLMCFLIPSLEKAPNLYVLNLNEMKNERVFELDFLAVNELSSFEIVDFQVFKVSDGSFSFAILTSSGLFTSLDGYKWEKALQDSRVTCSIDPHDIESFIMYPDRFSRQILFSALKEMNLPVRASTLKTHVSSVLKGDDREIFYSKVIQNYRLGQRPLGLAKFHDECIILKTQLFSLIGNLQFDSNKLFEGICKLLRPMLLPDLNLLHEAYKYELCRLDEWFYGMQCKEEDLSIIQDLLANMSSYRDFFRGLIERFRENFFVSFPKSKNEAFMRLQLELFDRMKDGMKEVIQLSLFCICLLESEDLNDIKRDFLNALKIIKTFEILKSSTLKGIERPLTTELQSMEISRQNCDFSLGSEFTAAIAIQGDRPCVLLLYLLNQNVFTLKYLVDFCSVLEWLDYKSQDELLEQIIPIFDTFCGLNETDSRALMFFKGRLCCRTRISASKEYFLKAAEDLDDSKGSLMKCLQRNSKTLLIDSLDIPIKGKYFYSVMLYLQHYEMWEDSLFFGRLVLLNDSKDDKIRDSVHSSMIESSMKIGDYFKVLNLLPHLSTDPIREACIAKLISCSFDQGDFKEIIHLPLGKYQSAFEDILLSKKFDLKFSNVIYSYFVVRQDFRNAASVMYEKGLYSKNACDQTKAFLAAYNSIQLVHSPTDRWITVNQTGSVQVINETDMYKSYLLCLAKLTLTKLFKEMTLSGKLDAHDAVTLLSNSFNYDLAFEIASCFNCDMEPIFHSLVLQNEWIRLDNYLSLNDTKTHKYRIYCVKVGIENSFDIPPHLMSSCCMEDSLIAVLLNSGCFEDASKFLLDKINHEIKTLHPGFSRAGMKCFPIQLIKKFMEQSPIHSEVIQRQWNLYKEKLEKANMELY